MLGVRFQSAAVCKCYLHVHVWWLVQRPAHTTSQRSSHPSPSDSFTLVATALGISGSIWQKPRAKDSSSQNVVLALPRKRKKINGFLKPILAGAPDFMMQAVNRLVCCSGYTSNCNCHFAFICIVRYFHMDSFRYDAVFSFPFITLSIG